MPRDTDVHSGSEALGLLYVQGLAYEHIISHDHTEVALSKRSFQKLCEGYRCYSEGEYELCMCSIE